MPLNHYNNKKNLQRKTKQGNFSDKSLKIYNNKIRKILLKVCNQVKEITK